ncbi:hypothetical protein Mal4_21050 [Maioricimonas rarisocia]|uniref:DUF1772 domain-containing protein n=1 Tax=Maioricimonas rarisocia TaxID=2528026 RepID=A0A517Z5M0_9PLAN|nr:hypothetical protein [Maioricimonas rarisocia]QDU37788.1 hypothetical protein Mal4_21050 [Maioricimonas rarisocia]
MLSAFTSSLLLVHLFATVSMVGVIWIVQIVHYPLFADVGEDHFVAFEQKHQRLITWIVAPLMLAEAATAVALVRWPPVGLSPLLLWSGAALLLVVWLSTAAVQVPLHETLSQGFDADAHRRLVQTNWIRTAAWSLRGVIASLMPLSVMVTSGSSAG